MNTSLLCTVAALVIFLFPMQAVSKEGKKYSGKQYASKENVEKGECTEGDCINGEGTMIYPGGAVYKGDWKKGKRHGQGLMTLPNGEEYLCGWSNGKRQGTLSFVDESAVESE